jgi:hypothetical protein
MCWWNLLWDEVSRALPSAFRHGFIANQRMSHQAVRALVLMVHHQH